MSALSMATEGEVVEIQAYPSNTPSSEDVKEMHKGSPTARLTAGKAVFIFFFNAYFRLVDLAFGLYNRFFAAPMCHAPFPVRTRPEDEIYFLTASKAAKYIREGRLTSKQLVGAYVDRVRAVNGVLNALLYDCGVEAMEQACSIDVYLRELNRDSDEFLRLPTDKPLLGVPFTVKNNMDVRGYPTMAGNSAFASNPPATSDARVVQQLREAGAIPMAITTLPWLAYDLETWDEIGKHYTCNPYDLRRTAGGSSGGEGALVGAGASLFGVGNDSGGSIRIPAGMCGCFGLKPTAGLIPLDGMVPPVAVGSSMEEIWSIGPLCRYEDDLSTLLRCMLIEPGLADSKLRLNESVDLSQLRLFYMCEFGNVPSCEPVHQEVKMTISRVAQFFEMNYGTHAQKVNLPLADWASEMWFAYVDRDEPPPNDSLAKIAIDTCRMLLPGRSSTTYGIAREMHSRLLRHFQLPTMKARQRAIEMRTQLRAELDDLLADTGLLLLPSYPPAFPPYHGEYAWKRDNWLYAGIANIVGFPAITIPLGVSEGEGDTAQIPTSVHLMGRMYSERVLIAAAKELERSFGGWTPLRE